ncbi:pheromone autoinducer 2 transporter [Enterococcus sp. 12E11_DIV0728]|nr:pheromone autoinducer 2 transporter [Enterococcus sp. 12E11_DIV0728]OUZ13678.1 pheromone autoinducer 2 transporter [Enterococcus sp. 12F9_DIV0723]
MLTRFKQSKLFFWTAEIVLTIIGIYFLLLQTGDWDGFGDLTAVGDCRISLLHV